MNLDAIRESDIATAITMTDLDAACAFLQAIAKIPDGGVAGLCFSDVYFDWTKAGATAREEKIRAWLATERNLARD